MSNSKNMVVAFEDDSTFQHCCGVTEVGGFHTNQKSDPPKKPDPKAPWKYAGYDKKPYWWDASDAEDAEGVYEEELEAWKAENTHQKVPCSGTGMFVATFIDTEDCRAAYQYLKEEHHLLFQSKPHRNNGGAGNAVFICVFLHKDRAPKKRTPVKVEREEAIASTWPLQRKGEKLPKL